MVTNILMSYRIHRIGNQLRLVRRRGGGNGASKMSTTNEQEGQLLFIHSPRTVYYIGGQPGDVKVRRWGN